VPFGESMVVKGAKLYFSLNLIKIKAHQQRQQHRGYCSGDY